LKLERRLKNWLNLLRRYCGTITFDLRPFHIVSLRSSIFLTGILFLWERPYQSMKQSLLLRTLVLVAELKYVVSYVYSRFIALKCCGSDPSFYLFLSHIRFNGSQFVKLLSCEGFSRPFFSSIR
jgi:hypothetical protein